MSSTRHAQPGGPFRQERYASSYHQGLLANLVAQRCAMLPKAKRAPIWFIQQASWRDGQLADLCDWLCDNTCLIGTDLGKLWFGYREEGGALELHDFIKSELEELCLNPNQLKQEVWRIAKSLRDKAIDRLEKSHETEIGELISTALDYTCKAQCLTIIEGVARIGKSFATRHWCNESVGMARLVETPCSNDDMSFFRAIAKALGVSASLKLKAVELRERVEAALASLDLTLVFDEAHYLWPQNGQRFAMPARVNWIMTALVNRGVPVALVTTPQFHKARERVEKLTGWASEQFIGRIGHLEKLPTDVAQRDLLAIARLQLPGAGKRACEALAAYAEISKKHLASIEAISKRAHWLAEQAGRVLSDEDVRTAMKECQISDGSRPSREPRATQSRTENLGRQTVPATLVTA
jgi:hypothetical protein